MLRVVEVAGPGNECVDGVVRADSLFDSMKNPGIDAGSEYSEPVSNLPFPVIRYDSQGQRHYMNDAAMAMIGAAFGAAGASYAETGLLSPQAQKAYLDTSREVAITGTTRDTIWCSL